MRSWQLLVLVLALVLVPACGGGGGGGGGGNPGPMQPNAGITFTPTTVGGQNSVSLQRNGVGATELVLQVQAGSVQGLYGVAFDLTFPNNLLRFQDATEGTFLGTGTGTSFLVQEQPAGNLVVGLSRLGAVGGVGGSGTLMTLRFVAIGSGSGTFQFNDNDLFDSSGGPIAGSSWGGGSVQVQL